MAWTLQALLNELRRNILHDRSDQVGGSATDYLWDDDTLIRYINEAQRRFARKSLCIRDNTSPVTTFTTVAGQVAYPLDKSVIAVLSVRMTGDRQDLPRAGHDPLNSYHTPDTLFFDAAVLERLPPGKALCWATDESVLEASDTTFSAVNLTLYPMIAAPYDGVTGRLRVVREPINDFTSSNMAAVPEIPASHHLDMLDWAGYLALRSPDTDVAGANAFQRAQDLAGRFEVHCKDAWKLAMRKMFAQQEWAFGHNGWSWES